MTLRQGIKSFIVFGVGMWLGTNFVDWAFNNGGTIAGLRVASELFLMWYLLWYDRTKV